MNKFRTVIFNGYQKDAVDDYVDELIKEVDELREDALKGQSVEQLNEQIRLLELEKEKLQEQVKTLEAGNSQKEQVIAEQEKQISMHQKQLDEMKLHSQQREQKFEEERRRFASLDTQLMEKDEKLKKYENDYSDFMDLMVNMKSQARQIVMDAKSDAEEILLMAKKDAEEITSTAQTDAEKITFSAQADAEKITDQVKLDVEAYCQNVEKEMGRRREAEAEKFKMARYKIAGYLESLNRSQNKLLEVYEEFGRIVGQLPLRLGDVFSEEDFQLLEDPSAEKTSEHSVAEEAGSEPFSSQTDSASEASVPYSSRE